MKTLAILAVILSLLGGGHFVAGVAEANVVFDDGEFLPSNWQAQKITDTTPDQSAAFQVAQQTEGGNPARYRWVWHKYFLGAIYVAHLRAGAEYDPSLAGAIETISYSYDLIHLNAPTEQCVHYSLLILQNGVYYEYTPPGSTPYDAICEEVWTHFAHSGLGAGDFELVLGQSGPAHPDFSSSGGLVHLGYVSANSTHSGSWTERTSGLDNWSVEIVTVGPTHVATSSWGLIKALCR